MKKIIEKGHQQYIFDESYFSETESKINKYVKLNPFKNYKRLINFALIYLQDKLKTSCVFGYPSRLILDPCSKCILNCPICPTGIGDNSRPRGLMKYSDFCRLMDEIGDYLLQIDLVDWGEPLLNDKIFDMVKYCKKKGMPYVRFDSNLNFFKKEFPERLIYSGLDELYVSIDGLSQETYCKYRVGGNYSQVIENLKAIVAKKKELHSKRPFIVWGFLVFRHNQHEIKEAINIAEKLGVDAIKFSSPLPDAEILIKDPKYILDSHKDLMVERGSEFSIFDKNGGRRNHKNSCDWLWKRSVINWNGYISPCCTYYPQKYDFGNCFNEGSFQKIWNGDKYKQARRVVKAAKSESPIKKIDASICDKCAFYKNYI